MTTWVIGSFLQQPLRELPYWQDWLIGITGPTASFNSPHWSLHTMSPSLIPNQVLTKPNHPGGILTNVAEGKGNRRAKELV